MTYAKIYSPICEKFIVKDLCKGFRSKIFEFYLYSPLIFLLPFYIYLDFSPLLSPMSTIHPSNLSPALRLLIGFITLIPITYWVFNTCYYFGLLPDVVAFYIRFPEIISWGLEIASLLIWVYFVYVLISLETIGVASKLLWMIRFALMAPVSMPIFWFYFIWRSEEYGEWEEE